MPARFVPRALSLEVTQAIVEVVPVGTRADDGAESVPGWVRSEDIK
jgi:hypothetical protein